MLPRQRAILAIAALCVTGLVATSAPAHAQPKPRLSASQLAARVSKALKGSTAAHVDYTFHIADVGNISHAPKHATAPASNEKLFTTITLLKLVGSQFRYTTTISGTAPIKNGTLHGDLVLTAAGDPTLTGTDLRSFAKRLHAKGLRHVTGRLVVDDTRYSHTTRVSGWKHKFVPEESGTVDAFAVDGDEWRSGNAFEADPTPDNAQLWRHALNKSHITVGKTLIEKAPPGLHHLVTHRSAALSSIVADTLTNSVNFYAEMMLREAGAQLTGHGGAASGVAAEHEVAGELGLPLGTVHDGSGLSYTDRETPATIVAWLKKLKTLSSYDTVYFGLPLSCDTGTLEGRLCGPNVRGRIRAKTGTLDHNSALSGYFQARSGDFVTFSILASGFKDKNFTKIYNHVDAAIEVVARSG
ncbi:MAG TPA: D-alanyl-D-alanine carboxypeptidase [Mycobacteriales bacterium]|jgi:D-alanyl-D-alanine carboxypeptidase/D-alanyl-D-alanine-endopeptidase (penicillin-binding protein 4)|nr:D-alanyl-D-alanine carboxypeptidase [Mycobacteriales bacterium]